MVQLNKSNLDQLGTEISVPSYLADYISTGIAHFGVGGFHRSHGAMYIDRLLSQANNKGWGICGIGLLPADSRMRDTLRTQDNLYSLIIRHPSGESEVRVIGSISEYLFAPDSMECILEKLSSGIIKIVSLTITEDGYNVSDINGEFDFNNPVIVADLMPGAIPQSVFGILTETLRRIRKNNGQPFTVMSCDNIEGNGGVAKKALVSFAHAKDPDLAAWIIDRVSFPNSMVDRITPVTTQELIDEVTQEFGIADAWPVAAESFEQWVLEDNFVAGRPSYENVGVQIVPDVAPYELMKLRLLNASHQALAYLGILAGYTHVHEAMRDPIFRVFLLDYMTLEATPTLLPVPGIDLAAYRVNLIDRFSNPAISDTLARLAVDGSARIPKFLLPVVRQQLSNTGTIQRAATVIAAWGLYLAGFNKKHQEIPIVDRRAELLGKATQNENESPGALIKCAEIFGDLGQEMKFMKYYLEARARILQYGAVATMKMINDAERTEL